MLEHIENFTTIKAYEGNNYGRYISSEGKRKDFMSSLAQLVEISR